MSLFWQDVFFHMWTLSNLKVSEYPLKRYRSMLKKTWLCYYIHILSLSLNVLRPTFLIYVICLFYALQISAKLGSKLGQKLTTFPTLWAPAPTELHFSIFFFHWYVAYQETNKTVPAIFFPCEYFLNNHILTVYMENTLSKLVELLL